jgi:hypothetical protein
VGAATSTAEFVGNTGAQADFAFTGGGKVTFSLEELYTEAQGASSQIRGQPNWSYRGNTVPVGVFHVWVDGGYRNTVVRNGQLAFSVEPGNHKVSIRDAQNFPNTNWQGKMKIAVEKGATVGAFDDVAASFPVRVDNRQPYATDNAPQFPAQGQIQTDGPLKAQISFAPNHSVVLAWALQVDGGRVVQAPPLQPGAQSAIIDLGPVAAGTHTVKVWPTNINWQWKYWMGTLTLWGGKKKALPKSCPTCGAQPAWKYACVKCGKLFASAKPTGTHDCGQKLDALVESIVYPCPNCKKTVQDEDKDCWSCGAQLQGSQQKNWK